MLNHLEKIFIFWNESSIYVLVYSVYAVIVSVIFFLLEIKLHKGAASTISGLALSNALLALFAIILFTASMLVSGWYAKFLGGEIGAFIIAVTITALALYFVKTYAIGLLALGYDSARVPGITAAAILAAPYTLGTLFVFVLASSMRN